MEVIIRKVSIEDLNKISEIELECFPKAEAATIESFEKRIKTFAESFFVAEIDNEIIGFINGAITNSEVIFDELYEDASLHKPNGDYQSIFGLDVFPKYQHNGIARKLMNHMIESAQNKNCKGLILTCKDRLIDFYESFGYKNMGISKSTHGGAIWYNMILEF